MHLYSTRSATPPPPPGRAPRPLSLSLRPVWYALFPTRSTNCPKSFDRRYSSLSPSFTGRSQSNRRPPRSAPCQCPLCTGFGAPAACRWLCCTPQSPGYTSGSASRTSSAPPWKHPCSTACCRWAEREQKSFAQPGSSWSRPRGKCVARSARCGIAASSITSSVAWESLGEPLRRQNPGKENPSSSSSTPSVTYLVSSWRTRTLCVMLGPEPLSASSPAAPALPAAASLLARRCSITESTRGFFASGPVATRGWSRGRRRGWGLCWRRGGGRGRGRCRRDSCLLRRRALKQIRHILQFIDRELLYVGAVVDALLLRQGFPPRVQQSTNALHKVAHLAQVLLAHVLHAHVHRCPHLTAEIGSYFGVVSQGVFSPEPLDGFGLSCTFGSEVLCAPTIHTCQPSPDKYNTPMHTTVGICRQNIKCTYDPVPM